MKLFQYICCVSADIVIVQSRVNSPILVVGLSLLSQVNSELFLLIFCVYPSRFGVCLACASGVIHNGYPRGCGCCSPHQHHCCKSSGGAGQPGQLAVLSAVSPHSSSSYFQVKLRCFLLLHVRSPNMICLPMYIFATVC